jgi:cytolysin (calcineurin-like family phosphatase)
MLSRALVSRRQFLATTAGAACFLAARPAYSDAPPSKLDLSFWHVSDTHFYADENNLDRIDPQSLAVNDRVIHLLNTLPGSELPASVGGGVLPKPIGVIHTGDTIDSGDKQGGVHPRMQRTEWAAYVERYGLNGSDGQIKYPVYELHGNHDSPHGGGLVLEQIADRNKRRPGVTHVSKNGLHYSWDWGPVHFLCLGIVVGGSTETQRQRRYNPLESYEFLQTDLTEKVGKSGRPVVICHHVDVARYTGPCKPDAPYENKNEWDPCDVHAFYRAIKDYNVLAVLYGHTHVRKIYKWDGLSATAKSGIDVFNVDDASHYRGAAHGIYHFHITDTQMTVREYATRDHWKTAAWVPALTKSISLAKI